MSAARRAVLLVDDQEEFRDLLTWAFVDAGHEVAAVASGARAIEMIHSARFDAVIIDLRLPDMSGTEVIQEVRSRGCSVPVVVVSGYAGCLEMSRLKELDVARVLPKPVHLETLMREVARIFAARADGKVREQTQPLPQPQPQAQAERVARAEDSGGRG